MILLLLLSIAVLVPDAASSHIMKDWKLKMEMWEWKKITNSDINMYGNVKNDDKEEFNSQFAGKG